jgi:hypothetical protein
MRILRVQLFHIARGIIRTKDQLDRWIQMQTYQWNGHPIHVSIRPFARFLWLGFAIEVRVGSRIFIPKFDRLGLVTSTDFEIVSQDGTRASGVVKTLSPMLLRPRVQCAVIIDDEIIAREIIRIDDGYRLYLAWLTVAVLPLFTLIVLDIATVILNR